jgi:hypothetical protein
MKEKVLHISVQHRFEVLLDANLNLSIDQYTEDEFELHKPIFNPFSFHLKRILNGVEIYVHHH